MTKITIIGGGSFSWGPTFLRDIFVSPRLKGSTICLEDIDQARVDLTYSLGQKMIRDFNLDFRLEKTLDLDQSLDGTDVIIMTITTGGFETMRPDLEIPARFGIIHTVGDTVGPAGLSRALRNIPVVAEISKRVDKICPNALFLNYTNPLSVLTRTVDKFRSVKNRTIGLCHEWHGVRNKLAGLFSTETRSITAKICGINHLPWAFDLQIEGTNGWDRLLTLGSKILAGELTVDDEDTSPFADHFLIKMDLLNSYGALPVAGDRHIAEFFGNYINPETEWGDKWRVAQTSVDYREGLQAFEKSLIESSLAGETPLEPFMQEASGESASEIITSLVTGEKFIGIMNLPNEGQTSSIPAGSIVETYGYLDATGAHGDSIGPFPKDIQAIIEKHVQNQELTVEAAMTGSRKICHEILMNDPFMRKLRSYEANEMLDQLISANQKYLLQF